MEKFEEIERELKLLVESIGERLRGSLPYLDGDKKKKEIREIENDIDEAYALVGMLQDHAALAPSGYSIKMNSRIRNFERNLERFQTSINETSIASTRKLLFTNPLNDLQNDSHSNYLKNASYEKLNRLNDVTVTIERSNKVANDTEQVGTQIFSDLDHQHQQLTRTRDRLTGTQETLSKTKRIIFLIQTKVMGNKLVLMFIIFLELAILAGVIYIKFFKK